MTINEVCRLYGISQDTLRYYERVGAIPEVNRTSGGIRDYSEEDLKWVQNAICLRDAGVSIEAISEYVKLSKQGDKTIKARLELLNETKKEILENKKKYDEALDRLDYKIKTYEKALKTGKLVWKKRSK